MSVSAGCTSASAHAGRTQMKPFDRPTLSSRVLALASDPVMSIQAFGNETADERFFFPLFFLCLCLSNKKKIHE